MKTNRANPNDRWRRYKLAAIPVLGLALAWVIYANVASSGPAAVVIPAGLRRPAAAASAPDSVVPARMTDWSQWPRYDLQKLALQNPFRSWSATDAETPAASVATQSIAPPMNAADTSVEESDTPDPPRSAFAGKVQAIYRDQIGVAALVDARVIRTGDVLEGGLCVKEITAEGILVEPQSPAP